MANPSKTPARRVQSRHLARWRTIAGAPPHCYPLVNETTLRALAAGHPTSRLCAQARELVRDIEATLLEKPDSAPTKK
jgi:hypothetical protein